MRDFRTLIAWKRAHAFVLRVYEIAPGFPQDEQYGLTSQVKRSAASVPTNIAEGCGSDGGLEFARFLQMAVRSASELDYQLLLARDLGFIRDETHRPLEDELGEIKRILNALIHKVRRDVRNLQSPGKDPIGRPKANS